MIATTGIRRNAIQEIAHSPKKYPKQKKIMVEIKGINATSLAFLPEYLIIETIGIAKKIIHKYPQVLKKKPKTK
jgi:hypothetical protein